MNMKLLLRDQHRRGGDHPGLDDRVPKLSFKRRRPVVLNYLTPLLTKIGRAQKNEQDRHRPA
jgi:hypothetical protein